MQITYQDLWTKTRDHLANCLTEDTFNDTFGEVTKVVKFINGNIFVLVPDPFIKSKINNMYIERINDILKSLTPDKLKFKFVCENEVNPEVKKENITTNNRLFINNLNENFSFESFVVGESNMFGYRMSLNVAEQPGV